MQFYIDPRSQPNELICVVYNELNCLKMLLIACLKKHFFVVYIYSFVQKKQCAVQRIYIPPLTIYKNLKKNPQFHTFVHLLVYQNNDICIGPCISSCYSQHANSTAHLTAGPTRYLIVNNQL